MYEMCIQLSYTVLGLYFSLLIDYVLLYECAWSLLYTYQQPISLYPGIPEVPGAVSGEYLEWTVKTVRTWYT